MENQRTIQNRYVLERKLGVGGLGTVFLARDYFDSTHSDLSRPVALKFLKDQATDYIRRKFEQEKEALCRIRHPFVVEVLDAGVLEEGIPWFAMQYVEGLSLRDAIALYANARSGLDFPVVGRWIRQLGQALAAAHAVGVFHRDLKPENIALQQVGESEYQIKIIDFGFAKVEDSLFEGSSSNLISGTPNYMAPEQLFGSTTPASDVFTLGAIAYEMLTGATPFPVSGESLAGKLAELAERQQRGQFIPPGRLRADLPPDADELIRKSLNFDPAQRPASADFFGEELERLLWGAAARTPRPTREAGGVLRPALPRAVENTLVEPGGALPIGSPFYIVRETDRQLLDAVKRRDGIILIQGARQMGKTSLLARGLNEARTASVNVVFTDFQVLSAQVLVSAEAFYKEILALLVDALDLDIDLNAAWRPERGPALNFERVLRREILQKLDAPLVWGIDEADRLFGGLIANEVFGLFRSWHNERVVNPDCPWSRLTMLISYATEAHLFITDLNQSPFNTGTRVYLNDFTPEQVSDLNERYGNPLPDRDRLDRFYRLTGGQPYLTQKGLYELARQRFTPETLFERAEMEEGPYGEHLRRLALSLRQEPTFIEAIRTVLRGDGVLPQNVFYLLRSSSVLTGDSPATAGLRCELYRRYLQKIV
jgi:hypothetical protein